MNKQYFLSFIYAFVHVVSIAQGLQIKNNVHLVLKGAVKLDLKNANFTNDANFNAGDASTVKFTGNVSQALSGSRPVTFQNMEIAKTGGTNLLLNNDLTIRGILTMTSGNLQVNNRTLNLGDNATIVGEGPNSAIVGNDNGKISTTRNLTTPVTNFNPGNIGIELTTKLAPGVTIFERISRQETLVNGFKGIKRSYNIVPTKENGLNATLKLYYLDTELAGNNESDLVTWRQTPKPFIWTQLGRDANNTQANWVLKSNISTLGKFTLGSKSTDIITSALAFPNPTTSGLTVELKSIAEGDIVLSLYEQSGKLLEQKKTSVHTGINQVQWDLTKYPQGSYYLVFDNSGLTQLQVIKVK